MIFLSTSSFPNLTGYDASCLYISNDINHIELSGGKFDPDCAQRLESIQNKANLILHNYFPPPREPFVFNLASLNKSVGEKSLSLATSAIDLASRLDLKYYSFHAGFLIDPKISDLGRQFDFKRLQNKKDSIDTFLGRVEFIASYARSKKIELLIENNVFSLANKKHWAVNPFLMTDMCDCLEIIPQTPPNVSLLVDVGHLNVSASSENFNKVEFLNETKPLTKGYHISENDGMSDINLPISKDSWFWEFINPSLDYYSLEIGSQDFNVLKEQLSIAEDSLCKYSQI